MENILEIKGLSKNYSDFCLNDISFSVPSGSIVGLIGENGAGKSTILKLVSEVINSDNGEISIFGQGGRLEVQEKSKLAVVFDGSNFADVLTAKSLNVVLKNIYPNWNESTYFTMVEKFQLPTNKKIKSFSKGMKMKLSIIVAFSHEAVLMILDEPTSGLDPVVRDDILNLFLDFVSDEKKSILVSSHITSDLEKIADYIVFIHKGKLIFSLPKDELMYNYGLVKCGASDFENIAKDDIISFRKLDYSYEVLVSNREDFSSKYPKLLIENISIDDIMLLYIKGEKI